MADNLPGWQDPEKVNRYFKLYFNNLNLFANDDCIRLKTLYQLRHSIVHTGGTLTIPDAQKVETLKGKGGTQLSFENNFIFEVSRKLHPLVKDSVSRIKTEFDNNLRPNLTAQEIERKEEFFDISSTVAVWLR